MRPYFCQGCCRQSPLRQVRFRRIQGFVLFYVEFTAEGSLCKACIHRLFWKMTLLTAASGWWGFKSVLLTFSALRDNTREYWRARDLKPTSEPAPRLGAGSVVFVYRRRINFFDSTSPSVEKR